MIFCRTYLVIKINGGEVGLDYLNSHFFSNTKSELPDQTSLNMLHKQTSNQ